MKKSVILPLAVGILAVAGLYFLIDSSDLQGRFKNKIKTPQMESEATDEFKPTINGMEAESEDE